MQSAQSKSLASHIFPAGGTGPGSESCRAPCLFTALFARQPDNRHGQSRRDTPARRAWQAKTRAYPLGFRAAFTAKENSAHRGMRCVFVSGREERRLDVPKGRANGSLHFAAPLFARLAAVPSKGLPGTFISKAVKPSTVQNKRDKKRAPRRGPAFFICGREQEKLELYACAQSMAGENAGIPARFSLLQRKTARAGALTQEAIAPERQFLRIAFSGFPDRRKGYLRKASLPCIPNCRFRDAGQLWPGGLDECIRRQNRQPKPGFSCINARLARVFVWKAAGRGK